MGREGLRTPKVSASPGCLSHTVIVLVLSVFRNSAVSPSVSSCLLGLAMGAGMCPGRDGMGQPAPAAGGLHPLPHAPFTTHTLGSSLGSSHLCPSDHLSFSLLRASAMFPGPCAACSSPYITCCEQEYLYTLSIMTVVSTACPASGKHNSHCVCRQH